jgi:hypothetical protein
MGAPPKAAPGQKEIGTRTLIKLVADYFYNRKSNTYQ